MAQMSTSDVVTVLQYESGILRVSLLKMTLRTLSTMHAKAGWAKVSIGSHFFILVSQMVKLLSLQKNIFIIRIIFLDNM